MKISKIGILAAELKHKVMEKHTVMRGPVHCFMRKPGNQLHYWKKTAHQRQSDALANVLLRNVGSATWILLRHTPP